MDECKDKFDELWRGELGNSIPLTKEAMEIAYKGFASAWNARTEAKVSGEVVGWFCQAGLIHTKEMADALKGDGYDVQPVYLQPAPQSPVVPGVDLILSWVKFYSNRENCDQELLANKIHSHLLANVRESREGLIGVINRALQPDAQYSYKEALISVRDAIATVGRERE